jgi:hypothetical protein
MLSRRICGRRLSPDDREQFRTATNTIIAACRTHFRQSPR